MARLSTHVLDTSRGCPAAGIQVQLYAVEPAAHRLIATIVTDRDGRAQFSEALPPARYEMVFAAGRYFGFAHFLEDVVVRFTISAAIANYHVPLLLSPYGYTTYRGS
jgi:5-hydroxyisourate hydrolase